METLVTRALVGVAFGVIGIGFWIGGMVLANYLIERKVDDDRYD